MTSEPTSPCILSVTGSVCGVSFLTNRTFDVPSLVTVSGPRSESGSVNGPFRVKILSRYVLYECQSHTVSGLHALKIYHLFLGGSAPFERVDVEVCSILIVQEMVQQTVA